MTTVPQADETSSKLYRAVRQDPARLRAWTAVWDALLTLPPPEVDVSGRDTSKHDLVCRPPVAEASR